MKELRLDINADVGEGVGNENKLFPFITSCNIACGSHAGDKETMISAVILAKEFGVKIGAHPSFKDKENFGRKILKIDKNGNLVQDSNGDYQVEKGSKLKEELNEINYAIGMEYWYNQQFAVRAGYFWEAATKGNRKFFTLGAGLKYNVFGLDFAYLIPAYFGKSVVVNSPLKNTLRFSLTFDFEGLKSIAEPSESISE